MVHFILAQQTTLNADYWSIKRDGERDIRQGDYQLSLCTLKNTIMSLKPLNERSKFKIGAEQNERH